MLERLIGDLLAPWSLALWLAGAAYLAVFLIKKALKALRVGRF
jgi:hypothetical protein